MSKHRENWSKVTRAAGDHREFVGPSNEYDLNAAIQFNLMTFSGLRESHTLLDIGCGSLRGGRLFIVFLRSGHYFGIEPEQWLVEKAISEEIGEDLVKLKSPSFSHDGDFSCDTFDHRFDYILAQGVFNHAPERLIRRYMSEAKKCMKTTSIFAATYKQGHENHTGTEWLYPDHATYTPEHMSKMASDAGLRCFSIDWPHPRGAKWILLCNVDITDDVRSLAERASRLYRTSQLQLEAWRKIVTRIGHFLRRLSHPG